MGIIVEDKKYSFTEFVSRFKNEKDHLGNSARFIQEWIDGKDSFIIESSGSSGKPKDFTLKRNQMEVSARVTGKVFGLAEGMSILMAFNPDYVAGKMILVRAMVLEMDVVMVLPSSNPLENLSHIIHFAPFVPLQMSTMLSLGLFDRLNDIQTILLGGAPILPQLENQLRKFSSSVYHSYGMTETASQVALRNINGSHASNKYIGIGDVKFTIQSNSCLSINGEVTDFRDVHTNDVVNLIDDRTFEWVGRSDNIINSGGIKVNPELLESALSKELLLNGHQMPFFVSSIPDEKLGEKIILVVEGKRVDLEGSLLGLKKYERPREIYFVNKFIRTTSGKINRAKTIEALRNQV